MPRETERDRDLSRETTSEAPVVWEPPLPDEVSARRKGLRSGWTTGTCASAAAKAALIGLIEGKAPNEVEVHLPGGNSVRFSVESERPNRCIVVKDAGDDPDCTHGARMTASVEWADPSGLTTLRAGPGVGVVTKPGLGIDVGEPSITDVPRRMILSALAEVSSLPVDVVLEVPGGEIMALDTTNARLGIVGGISILGTTGIVRPFSTAAYRASVVQQVDVASAQGCSEMVLATGHRSERAAKALRPDLDEVCFVEVGDFTGICLRRVAARGMSRATWVGMAGKVAKLAAGIMMTHYRRSDVDTALLSQVAKSCGAPEAIVEAATQTATARHFFEVCTASGVIEPLEALCRMARANCEAHVGGKIEVEVLLVDFEASTVVASA